MSATLSMIRPLDAARDCTAVVKLVHDDLKHVNSQFYLPSEIDQLVKRWTVEKLQELAKDPQRMMWVAEAEGKIVGVAGLYHNDIRSVFVDRKLFKRGIGSALVEAIEKVAKQKGISELKTMSSINAEGFYQSLGFEKRGELKTPDMGKLIVMQKKI